MDIQSITTAVGGLKTATEIIGNILSINKNAEVNARVIDLQNVILGLQSNLLELHSGYAQLLSEKAELETRLKGEDEWARVEKEYQLRSVGPDLYVYISTTLKPSHWLCPNCFQKKQKAILQMYNQNDYGRHYHCPNCGMKCSVR
jgi:predicted RNA-binding Zn-ribbon protein involved in translation (DUF1610 family)